MSIFHSSHSRWKAGIPARGMARFCNEGIPKNLLDEMDKQEQEEVETAKLQRRRKIMNNITIQHL